MDTISSADIPFARPPVEDYLGTYNGLIAGVLAAHWPQRAGVASITLSRQEGISHLYERVVTYHHLLTYLQAHPATRLQLAPTHARLLPHLQRTMGMDRVALDPAAPPPPPLPRSQWRRLRTMLGNIRSHFLGWWLLRQRPPDYLQAEIVVRSYADSRCYAPTFHDIYFGPVVQDLAQQHRTLAVYKLISRGRAQFLALRAALRTAPYPACAWDAFLGPLGTLRAAWACWWGRVVLDQPLSFHGCDITALVQEALDDEYYSLENLGAHYEWEVARRLLRLPAHRLIWPFENQSWEKVYPALKARLQATTTLVGYQHSGLSRKLLNYFTTPADRQAASTPDELLVVGDIIGDLMRREGAYGCPITVVGAVRYGQYYDGPRLHYQAAAPALKRAVAVAFSYDLENYPAMLGCLQRVFVDDRIQVWLKLHPIHRTLPAVQACLAGLPSHFRSVFDLPWSTVFQQVDCLLYEDTSVALEALIHGVHAYYLTPLDPLYDGDRLFDFTLWPARLDEAGVQHLRAQLLAGTYDKHLDEAAVTAYLRRYFAPYDPAVHLPLFAGTAPATPPAKGHP